jgi:hypothetical protein
MIKKRFRNKLVMRPVASLSLVSRQARAFVSIEIHRDSGEELVFQLGLQAARDRKA